MKLPQMGQLPEVATVQVAQIEVATESEDKHTMKTIVNHNP